MAEARIERVSFRGGLCNEYSQIAMSSDARAFTALFSDFYLEAHDGKERGAAN